MWHQVQHNYNTIQYSAQHEKIKINYCTHTIING